jgi:hypothetical protein
VPERHLEPRRARPVIRPLNILRNLTRFGLSIGQGPQRAVEYVFARGGLDDLALEDPDLHADGAVGGLRRDVA